MTSKTEQLYRVCWISKITCEKGHVAGIFPKDKAQKIVDEMRSSKSILYHWIDPVKEGE